MYDILELNKMLVPELKEIAKNLNIKRLETLRKQDLVYKILDQQAIEASKNKKPVKKLEESEEEPTEEISEIKEEVSLSEVPVEQKIKLKKPISVISFEQAPKKIEKKEENEPKYEFKKEIKKE